MVEASPASDLLSVTPGRRANQDTRPRGWPTPRKVDGPL
jgi:hypothetical protein